MREHEKEVYAVDWSHLGTKNSVVSGSWDTTAKVWNAEVGTCVDTFKGHYGVVYCTIWSPHVAECFASCSGTQNRGNGLIYVHDFCYGSIFPCTLCNAVKQKLFGLPYLPVYKSTRCISRPPKIRRKFTIL